MTPRADAVPHWTDGPPRPAPSDAATTLVSAFVPALSRVEASTTPVARARRVLVRMFRARLPSAHGLSDRQLADIGFARSDLPDHRGWRR